jgi:hypothetical protein
MALSQQNQISVPGLLASTAITQYSVVKFASTAGKVLAVAATTDIGMGICQNDPATGEPANVVVGGVAKAVAGTSTITQGETLGFNSTGQVVDQATDNRRSIGIALEASSAASGDYIRVLVRGADRF